LNQNYNFGVNAKADNTAEKHWGRYITSISVKSFNFDELFHFKISAGYKYVINCRKKNILCKGAFFWHF